MAVPSPEIAAAAIQARIAAGLPAFKTPDEKARENPKSLRLAINAKCWDCCAAQREEIRHCPMTDCSLHQLRPYK